MGVESLWPCRYHCLGWSLESANFPDPEIDWTTKVITRYKIIKFLCNENTSFKNCNLL